MKLLPMTLLRPARLALAFCALGAFGCGDNLTRTERPVYDAGGLPKLACTPNLDGVLTADELKPALDVPAKFLVPPEGTEREVDTAGKVSGEGKRTWNLGTDYKDEQVATVVAKSVQDTWFAKSFSGASFTTPLDLAGRTLSVYANDQNGITLLGLASAEENPPEGKTLYVYAQPILVLKFPLTVGTSWVSSSDVRQATLRGLPYAGKDIYEVSADASGSLALPDFTFTQVIRVKTKVTVQPSAGASNVRRQTSFFFECFGEVARAVSKNGEAQEDFTGALELRRLGL
jgi:hypothetical protein